MMRPEDVLDLYETKIKLRSFDELAPLIADDAVFWFSDGSHYGMDENQSRIRKNLAKSSRRSLLAREPSMGCCER